MTRHHYSVTFEPRSMDRGGGDLAAVFDMLRYDAANVVDWTTEGKRMTLKMSSERAPTVDRWASFGLHVKIGDQK